MPNTNPYKAGDIVYPQYSVVDTAKIKSGLSITKGNVYTFNNSGYLVGFDITSNAITNYSGFAQALDTVAAPSSGDSDGKRTVQVLRTRSRACLVAKIPSGTALNVGDSCEVFDTASNVSDQSYTTNQVQVCALNAATRIGEVFDILTPDANGNKKIAAAENDIVLVDVVR